MDRVRHDYRNMQERRPQAVSKSVGSRHVSWFNEFWHFSLVTGEAAVVNTNGT